MKTAPGPSPGFRLVERGALAELELSRPPANVLDIAFLVELTRQVASLPAAVRVLVLSGKPHFSAGVDIADHAPEKTDGMLAAVHGFLDAFLGVDCVTIAKIRGACLGGGAEIALSSDLRFVADDARIGFPEITLGCFPPAGLLLLPAVAGEAKALELLLAGAAISGREAERIGIANRSVEPARLDEETDRFCVNLLSRSPEAAGALWRELRGAKRGRFREGRARSEALYREVSEAPSLAHAVNEFLDRRDRR